MADFDAIVIGSGITGGWAAKELTERGLKVLMIERGRMIEHGNYENEMTPPWEMKFRGFGDPKLLREEYPIQRTAGIDEWTLKHFVNDKENPYESTGAEDYKWIRGYQVGGRSLTWGRQTYRWSDLDFAANARDGHGVDWPVRYADLAPWYDHVEEFIGVNGSAEGLPQLPDGKFQPSMPLGAGEKLFAERIAGKYSDRRLIPGRSANLTVEKEGRAPCQYRYICPRGCSFGAYFSTQSSTLPAAEKTGRLTLLTDQIVTLIESDPKTGKATAVRTIDANTKAAARHTARIFFVNAGSFNSVALLLRSASEAQPQGLANSSGTLGHYIMDHASTLVGASTIPELNGRTYVGNRPSNYLIPRFRNLDGKSTAPLRGYGYQGLAFREGWKRGIAQAGLGRVLREELSTPGDWKIIMVAFAECLPRSENRVALSKKLDQWGLPLVDIRFSFGENERALLSDAQSEAKDMLALLRGKAIYGTGEARPAIHEMGGARMGHDPRTSVVNKFNQAHDVPNLFITDGAAMSSSATVNPSLTYMAFTARAAAFAIDWLKS